MRTNAELNRLALMASQATAQMFLGPNAVHAINSAAMQDEQMSGLFDFVKKVVHKVGTTVKKVGSKAVEIAKKAAPVVAPIAASMIPGVGGMISQSLSSIIDNKEAQDAIAKGDVPPPPVDLNSAAYAQWATAIAIKNAGAAGNSAPMTDMEKQLLLAKIQSLQGQAVQQLPPQVQYMPMPQVPVPVQQAMAQTKDSNLNMQTMLLIGVPALLAVVLLARR